jgi:hypothetical protein
MTTSRSIAVLAIVGAVSFVPLQLGAQAVPPARTRPSADSVINRALTLMGGEQTLRGVERVTYRMMTQWQRTNFRNVPHVDQPSFEPHTDVRDYTLPAWRNTREFGTNRIVNVIRDSVALTTIGTNVQPLSIAYVDERAELFVYTPDRLVLALRDAPDLTRGADTVIGGERYTRVTATLADRFPGTVFFHRGTGLPGMLRFRAGHPNDFGLVAWGVMPVEVWYSAWRTFGAISIPAQWDIRRVGVPYKRMTVQSATFNPAFAADSFAVTPEQRAMYLTSSATRPMHENVVRRAVNMATPDIAMINAFGIQAGAVNVGNGWLMLGTGHTTFSYAYGERLLDSLGASPVTAVLAATSISATNGGVFTAVDRGIPVYVSEASEAALRRIFEGAARPVRGLTRVKAGMTIGDGANRMHLEPLDLPNVSGSVIAYAAHNGWLYAPDATTPLDIAVARERARALGWTVKAVGTAAVLYQPVTP